MSKKLALVFMGLMGILIPLAITEEPLVMLFDSGWFMLFIFALIIGILSYILPYKRVGLMHYYEPF